MPVDGTGDPTGGAECGQQAHVRDRGADASGECLGSNQSQEGGQYIPSVKTNPKRGGNLYPAWCGHPSKGSTQTLYN
eukprot:1179292-Prorocentrum_minimum.AAC.2